MSTICPKVTTESGYNTRERKYSTKLPVKGVRCLSLVVLILRTANKISNNHMKFMTSLKTLGGYT